MNTNSSGSNGNGLTTFEETKLWLAAYFPHVVYREGVVLDDDDDVQVISIVNMHPRRKGMFIEFCEVYHVPWEKDQLYK